MTHHFKPGVTELSIMRQRRSQQGPSSRIANWTQGHRQHALKTEIEEGIAVAGIIYKLEEGIKENAHPVK